MSQKLTKLIMKAEQKADSLMLPYMRDNVRGLGTFIIDIRNCRSHEEETKRVNKELVNIRSKFKSEKSLNGYHRKKYVAKLIYIHLLGYDVNFGHIEAIMLTASSKYSEKQIGHLFITILGLGELNDSLTLLTSSIKADLASANVYSLIISLQSLSHLINAPEVAEHLITNLRSEVLACVKNTSTHDFVRRSALLCYLSMLKVLGNEAMLADSDFHTYISQNFVNCDNSLLLQFASVIYEVSLIDKTIYFKLLPSVAERIALLSHATHADVGVDFCYYSVPVPWAQVKLLQVVQLFNQIDEIGKILEPVLIAVLKQRSQTGNTKRIHYLNIKMAICMEVINVIIHYKMKDAAVHEAIKYLMSQIVSKEINYRYLALETLAKFASNPKTVNLIKNYADIIVKVVIEEKDITVRLQAVNMLFIICNTETFKNILNHLFKFIAESEYAVRQELAVKTATLCEAYSVSRQAYIDSMFQLIQLAGECISEDIWFRLVHIIANSEQSVHGYAATQAFFNLQASRSNETLIKVCSYILGEYGNFIANDPRSSPLVQAQLFIGLFPFVGIECRGIFMNTLVKMANLYPEIKEHILRFFRSDSVSKNVDLEIQQRAVEFVSLLSCTSNFVSTVLDIMPPATIEELDLYKAAAPYTASSSSNMNDLFGSVGNEENPANSVSKNSVSLDRYYSSFFKNEIDQNNRLLQSNINIGGVGGEYRLIGVIKSISPANVQLEINVECLKNNAAKFSVSNVSLSNVTGLQHTIEVQDELALLASFITVVVTVNATSMFSQVPTLSCSINIDDSRQQVKDVPLPLGPHRFITGYQMDAAKFFQIWQALISEGQANSKEVNLTKQFNKGAIEAALMKLNISILPNIDNNQNNIVASGVFNCGEGIFGALVRIEFVTPQKVCLTVKSISKEFCGKIFEVLQKIITE